MYAIIKSGGKQYKVEPGMVIKVEKLDAEVGSEVAFEALLTSDGKKVAVGDPILKDVAVKGKVLAQDKAKKVIVFKYKPKKDYRKKTGTQAAVYKSGNHSGWLGSCSCKGKTGESCKSGNS